MNVSGLFWMVVATPLLVVCAAPAKIQAAIPYKAVLIAGDGSLPVFDNAVSGVGRRLRERGGAAAGDIQILSVANAPANDAQIHRATRPGILHAIATMKPAAGQGCLVFATSHGSEGRGLWLAASEDFLTPQALDRALVRGCGNAPTAVVISGCFTGVFARAPMARVNRIVITAARADRTSFGCTAGRTYTAFDTCFLAALDSGGSWPQAYAFVQRCVIAEERRNNVTPSEPQAWFGPAVAELALPVPGGHARP